MARLATQMMLGKKLADLKLKPKTIPYFGVKESVFPFSMFQEVDPVLGPEMRSTGEVLGMGHSFGLAFYKAEEAAGPSLPLEGTVLITVCEKDRPGVLEVAKQFEQLGFKIRATEGTFKFLTQNNIQAELIKKLKEGRPNILDAVTNKEIHLVINTPIGRLSLDDDSYIRKAAVKYKLPYITTLTAAMAAAKGIAACRQGRSGIRSLQHYHQEIG
jgi:carbamoyl-phosphate synthase large subunit